MSILNWVVQMNSALESLVPAVANLTSLYGASSSAGDTERREDAVFLSQIDLECYHKAEDLFTQKLTSFTKKQFFEARNV